MQNEFKVGQLVTLIDEFPFEGKIFKIVADKENPWKKATPFSFDPVQVGDDKDFILLIQQDNGDFSGQSISENGMHVTASQIKHNE